MRRGPQHTQHPRHTTSTTTTTTSNSSPFIKRPLLPLNPPPPLSTSPLTRHLSTEQRTQLSVLLRARFIASYSSFMSCASSSSSSDLEAGFSGCSPPRAVYSERMGGRTYRPRLFFCDDLDDDGPRHFLDACFLCKKHLGGNRDIFMYRGDTPFCSEECRQEQIEIDEERERNWKMSLKASSRKEPQHGKQQKAKVGVGGGGSPPKADKIHVRATGTVVAS